MIQKNITQYFEQNMIKLTNTSMKFKKKEADTRKHLNNEIQAQNKRGTRKKSRVLRI